MNKEQEWHDGHDCAVSHKNYIPFICQALYGAFECMKGDIEVKFIEQPGDA